MELQINNLHEGYRYLFLKEYKDYTGKIHKSYFRANYKSLTHNTLIVYSYEDKDNNIEDNYNVIWHIPIHWIKKVESLNTILYNHEIKNKVCYDMLWYIDQF